MLDDDIKEIKNLPDLTKPDPALEKAMEEYSMDILKVPPENPFEIFKSHRKLYLGKHLPLKVGEFIAEAERNEIEKIIDQIKGLGFFSAAYIDNLIIYFEVLKSPILGADYLTTIIDRYIRPDIRVQGIRPFQKFAIGYFCCELKKYGASIRPTAAMMVNHFAYSPSEVEKAIKDYKTVLEYVDEREAAYYVADLIGLWLLYQFGFDLDDHLHIFGDHHHSRKAKESFLQAYREFSHRIDHTYIPLIKDAFNNPPYLLEKIIIPELKNYIVDFDCENCTVHPINELAGILVSLSLLSMAPNLINDREKLLQLGWVSE